MTEIHKKKLTDVFDLMSVVLTSRISDLEAKKSLEFLKVAASDSERRLAEKWHDREPLTTNLM